MMQFEKTISSEITSKYVVLSFIAIINFSMLCIAVIMGYKLISFMGLTLSAGIFTFPLSYVCQDIVTEIYGYRLARILIWITFFALLLFSLLITALVDMKPILLWHHQHAYFIVLGNIFRLTLAIIISLIVGDFINAYVLSKWKIIFKGKSFWLRSLGSTAIGEAIDTLVGFGIAFIGVLSFEKFFALVLSTYAMKLLMSSVLVSPSSVTVSFLKNALKLDVYDYGVNFNPFRIKELQQTNTDNEIKISV